MESYYVELDSSILGSSISNIFEIRCPFNYSVRMGSPVRLIEFRGPRAWSAGNTATTKTREQ